MMFNDLKENTDLNKRRKMMHEQSENITEINITKKDQILKLKNRITELNILPEGLKSRN